MYLKKEENLLNNSEQHNTYTSFAVQIHCNYIVYKKSRLGLNVQDNTAVSKASRAEDFPRVHYAVIATIMYSYLPVNQQTDSGQALRHSQVPPLLVR